MVEKLFDGFFPNADSVTKATYVAIFILLLWLFNQIKKQFDDLDLRKIERTDNAIAFLCELLGELRKDSINKDKIYEVFIKTVPYLDYNSFNVIKDELEAEVSDYKLIERRVEQIVSTIKLRYSFLNENSNISLIFQIEDMIRPIKNIIKSGLVVFSLIVLVFYLLFLYMIFDNEFLTGFKFATSLLWLLILIGVVELFFKKQLNINFLNITLFIMYGFLSMLSLISDELWILIVSFIGYIVCLIFLLKSIRIKKKW
ncbi:hypothetical protein [Metabacillus litoralis]|uniref:hypothetical protein n=1 Tax=Metabacillus litoralis TaxID=152268 RepID=UPI00203F49E2|nr:hypothetical protein [Metabacillus litoralis]MCM3162720.1 hypothetical protein [Metabacillus litoralis]